ncbi:MAG: hypothetical protein ACTSVZ_07685 [Promethearchaeota archaeon]
MTQNNTWALVLLNIDNILLNNYWRKYYTYLEVGWDEESIHQYLSEKEKILQIASFHTNSVSFSASSRRNKFYKIYNRKKMLDQDVPMEGAVDALKKISKKYHIYVVSARTNELEEKTLEALRRLSFPVDQMTIFFKKPIENLHEYREKTMEQIVKQYPMGVGICLSPSDRTMFDPIEFIPIAFTSIKNQDDFQNGSPSFQVICNSWQDVMSSLKCQ